MFGGFHGKWPQKGSSHTSQAPGVIQGVFLGSPNRQVTARLIPYNHAEDKEERKDVLGNRMHWTAPFLDGSGYAEAARNYVAALATAGVEVIAKSVDFHEARANYGRAGKFAKAALERNGECDVNVIFLPPEHFNAHKRLGYNIGLFDWEMEGLPSEWVPYCNFMDEIWSPCKWTADTCKRSGVVRPIHVFGHCASPEDYGPGPAIDFPEIPQSWFKFYSIFQWTERKNPAGLLKAYLQAFKDSDPVVLILKTYGADYSESEVRRVMGEIERVKKEVGGRHQPRILALLGMMTKDEMLALHRLGDCFILIHRAEGWGLPHFEACMMGKPVITTAYSSVLEFLTPESSFLVGYRTVPVTGMEWFKWFEKGMTWAEPDVEECSRLMRHVFHNRDEAKKKGKVAQAYVENNFTWSVVGGRMKARLAQIAALARPK